MNAIFAPVAGALTFAGILLLATYRAFIRAEIACAHAFLATTPGEPALVT